MVNKVTLIGRLGKDPVIKHFQNDSAIAEFSLATTDSYKDREGKWVEMTDWHNIKLPSKQMAERAEKFLKKGMQVYIEGKIKTRSYDDKDGSKRYITEVVVERFSMLEKRDSNSNGGGDNYAPSYSQSNQSESTGSADMGSNTPATNIDDDLPF